VFTGDYARGKDWLFQSRLGTGGGEWSAPSSRRAFEFTNLSEGNFRFEIRAVNSAGLTSEPAIFSFSILPPWYRSGWAYAGYAASLALVVFGFIRIRERRIRIRNRELETLVDIRTQELVKANAAKDEFLASVSHEIRNPMNGVIGIAETFKTETLDLESRHKFGLLRQCASHLSSLLEDILDFSRVQAGAVELEAKPFDLPELVESIAAITAAESGKRGIPVEIAISPAVPQRLTGDPRRIRQILLNFVSNALKFSGRGQVSVTVWCKAAGAQLTEVIFAVSDEGPGISAEEQKKLFTRFERGAAAQQGRVPGTGLGLALCRALAEKMGGRIWLESEPGEGSCFYFSAPFATAEALAQPAPISLPPAGDFKTALVVDDEEYNRLALTGLLESLGFTVQTAADGQQALALAGSHDFDIMFIDYALPGLSGLDVTRTVRALPGRSAKAVILATTAFTTPDKRNQCLAAGMNAFLGKPVTMERLRQALSALNPAGTPVAQPRTDDSAPADGLANLRLLATKKCVPLAEELALYFSELEVELEQLTLALQQEEAGSAGHYAHLLYGRCAFIYERELEQTLRKTEAAAATGRWADARLLSREVRTQLAGLRVRLALGAPIAPPG
jgi:signal transduction histidine kinase/CheY-like chemotaxis protein/HPt (histidine-containing phosphotransfer) domain-containing protein